MKNILIHKSPDLSVTHFVDNLNVNQIHEKAQNMLDFGTLYRIGTIDELPADRTFRGAWDIDDADLNDGVAGEEKTKQNLSQLIAKTEQEKENLKQTKEQIDAAKSTVDTLNGELPELENKASECKTAWQSVEEDAFAAKEDYEAKFAAAETAEKEVEDAKEATEEQKNNAIELRKVADEAFTIQDHLFAKINLGDRAGLHADLLVESKKSEIEGANSTIEMLEPNISEIESSIENGNSAISICENKLNELLEKLPLEKRRGYIEPIVEQPEIEEKQDDQS
jgi:chromosome segregation ATPase